MKLEKTAVLKIMSLLLILLTVACNSTVTGQTSQTKTLFVGPEQVDCVGEMEQKCFLVKENAEEEYTYLYDSIKGFEWESGFEYELLVKVTEIENPPADGSSREYELVEIVSKKEVAIPPATETVDGNWSLNELILDGTTIFLPQNVETLLIIEGETISGSVGCNNFNGTATFKTDKVSFGPLATTRMLCSEEIMAIEDALLALFQNTIMYTLEDGSLKFHNADNSGIAVFSPQEEVASSTPSPALDGKWTVIELVVDGTMVKLPHESRAFLLIEGENVSGNGGCNQFSGTLAFEDGQISLMSLASTEMACLDETIMTFEAAFLTLLSNVTTFTLGQDTLTLSNADVTMVATFAPVQEQVLYVGAEQVDCVGVAPQKCLLVKEDIDGEYTYFYGDIVGFEWEAGFEYELLVEVSQVANAPADASSLRYTLVEVWDKTAVFPDN